MKAEKFAIAIAILTLSLLVLVLIGSSIMALSEFFVVIHELVFANDNSLAYATWGLFFATVGLAIIAFIKLGAAAKQQRIWSTLQTCDRYDTDPTLNRSIELLKEHFDYGRPLRERDFNAAAINLFNYFDAISIGIKHEMYDVNIVDAHLGGIVQKWIEQRFVQAIKGGNDKKAIRFWENYIPNNYEVFCELYDKRWASGNSIREKIT